MFEKLNNIKKRIASGFLLFSLLVSALIFYKGALVIIIMLIGIISFFELMFIHKEKQNLPYVFVGLAGFILMAFKGLEKMPLNATLKTTNITNFKVLDAKTIILFALFMSILPIFIKKINYKHVSHNIVSLILLSTSLRTLLWWLYKSAQHGNGYEIAFLLAGVVFAADIGGYLFGSLFGKRLINEHISPKKTWEGFFGGLVIAYIFSFIWTKLFPTNLLPYKRSLIVLITTPIIVISAIIGDLYYSQIKRLYKVKDFSKIIPGHGGLLDRVDSLLFSSTILYFLFQIIPV